MLTALIDADIIAFQAASVSQKWIPDDDGNYLFQVADRIEAHKYIREFIYEIQDTLGAEIVCALSDRDHNWRKDVLPSYKSNRKTTVPPVLRWEMYDYIKENYETFIRPSLEGDDVLGILSTASKIKGAKVIVSIDKDMKTIPGLILNWNHARFALNEGHISSIDEGIFEVTEEQADYFHLLQTIAGDPTDGYSGCPGIGLQTADKILQEEPHVMVSYDHEITRGKRKGEVETRWRAEPGDYTPWQTIVSHYEKAGLTEEDALQQARVARICRASDYDFKKKEVKLWHPQS